MDKLVSIPCNVITGFLGTGKTTAILQLLKQKPKHETWAILVNEFGQIGIDGKVIATTGAMVKEIPGGCMCCSNNGLPMQVALNSLIKVSRPDRLLIEPTGIGHPRQILKQLTDPPFDQLLELRACISLLDPRQLQEPRYQDNELFTDQIRVADVLVANKIDQCDGKDQQYFFQYLQGLRPAKQASGWVQQGQLDVQWLDLPHLERPQSRAQFVPVLDESEMHAETGYISYSWEFADNVIFSYQALIGLIGQSGIERFKALVKTDSGNVFINSVSGNISTMEIGSLKHSQFEMIQRENINKDDMLQKLQQCQSHN